MTRTQYPCPCLYIPNDMVLNDLSAWGASTDLCVGDRHAWDPLCDRMIGTGGE
jgi:hypothetical protein